VLGQSGVCGKKISNCGKTSKVNKMKNISYGTINVKFELVERAFSSYTFIKTNCHNKLNASPDL
jgi:hypothetical protein